MSDIQVLLGQLGTLSYVGIFIVSLLSNVVVPIPEEAVLLAFGYLAGTGEINVLVLLPLVFAGLLASDLIMYAFARSGNRVVTFFYNKFFARRLEKKRAWMETHIHKVIFFSRFLMQLRFLGPFMAGQMKVPLKRFLAYECAALIIYVPLLIWLGAYFRNRVEDIVNGVGKVHNLILIAIGIVLLISLLQFLNRWLFTLKTKNVQDR